MLTTTTTFPGKETSQLTIIINKDGNPETRNAQGLYVDLYSHLPLFVFNDLRSDFINHPLQNIHPTDIANPDPNKEKKERLYFYFFIMGHGDKVTYHYRIHNRVQLLTEYHGDLSVPKEIQDRMLLRLMKRCSSPATSIVNGKIGVLYHWNNW